MGIVIVASVAVMLVGVAVLASMRTRYRGSVAARRAAILHHQRATDQAISATVTTAIRAMLQSTLDRR